MGEEKKHRKTRMIKEGLDEFFVPMLKIGVQ